jgi:hypothetical protein
MAHEIGLEQDWSIVDIEAFVVFCEDVECLDDDDIQSMDKYEVAKNFWERYIGTYDSHEDFATWGRGLDSEVPEWALPHIDWDDVWEDQLRHEFIEESGHYFYQ